MPGTGHVSIHVCCSSESSWGLDKNRTATLWLSFKFEGENEPLHTLTIPVTPFDKKGEGKPGDDAQDIAEKIAEAIENKVNDSDRTNNPKPLTREQAAKIKVRTVETSETSKKGTRARPGVATEFVDTWADIQIDDITEIDTACCDGLGKVTTLAYGEDVGTGAASPVKAVALEIQRKEKTNDKSECPQDPPDSIPPTKPTDQPAFDDPAVEWKDLPFEIAACWPEGGPSADGRCIPAAALELEFRTDSRRAGEGSVTVCWPVLDDNPLLQCEVIALALRAERIRAYALGNRVVILGDCCGNALRSFRTLYSLPGRGFPWHVIWHMWDGGALLPGLRVQSPRVTSIHSGGQTAPVWWPLLPPHPPERGPERPPASESSRPVPPPGPWGDVSRSPARRDSLPRTLPPGAGNTSE